MALALKLCRCVVQRDLYAYVVLATATLGVLCASVGHSFMLAPYNERVRVDLGLSHSTLATIWLITLLSAALWVNVSGRLMDRYGPGLLIFLGGLLEGVAMVSFGVAEGPVTIGLVYFLVRLASVETVDFACRCAINIWWKRKRGFAVGVLHGISGFMLLLPAVETLVISSIGWRATATRVGVCVASLLVLLSLFILSRPEDYGLQLEGATEPGAKVEEIESQISSSDNSVPLRDYTFKEAVRTPLLWALIAVSLLNGIPWTGVNFLLSGVIEEAGCDQSFAAYVYVAFAALSSLTALVVGAIVDWMPTGRKQYAVLITNTTCAVALLTTASLRRLPCAPGCLLVGCTLGFWCGSNNVVFTTVVPNVFGCRHLGALQSLITGFATVSSASGPAVIAILKDVGLSFSTSFCVLAGCQSFGVFLILCAKSPERNHSVSGALGSGVSLIEPSREVSEGLASIDESKQVPAHGENTASN